MHWMVDYQHHRRSSGSRSCLYLPRASYRGRNRHHRCHHSFRRSFWLQVCACVRALRLRPRLRYLRHHARPSRSLYVAVPALLRSFAADMLSTRRHVRFNECPGCFHCRQLPFLWWNDRWIRSRMDLARRRLHRQLPCRQLQVQGFHLHLRWAQPTTHLRRVSRRCHDDHFHR